MCQENSSSQQFIPNFNGIDTLTKHLITIQFNEAEWPDLYRDTLKLLKLDYVFSKSFNIKEGQNYNLEDYLRIDIRKYNHLRATDDHIEVYDEDSGLTLILDSELDTKTKLPAFFFETEFPLAPSERLRSK